ncbi:maleylpyruvate isomerase family mycothiol-dependent enzyme [Blastococcus sp. SYSU D00820]
MPRHPRVGMLADVAAERSDLCDFLESLDEADWQVRSLCPAWTVHDVLAHLTLSHRQTLLATLVQVVRARGSFDAAEAAWARRLAAAHRPAELIALLRATADVDHRVPLSGPLDPLTDVLVHGQDIARPLGWRREVPPERAVPALQHVWGNAFYGRADRRFAGLRFVATDADWSAGEGPVVRGPAGSLLLVATGRAAGLAELTGPGRNDVAARFAQR